MLFSKQGERCKKKKKSRSIFLFFRELRKIWPPARKKKLEENSGPDPLLMHRSNRGQPPNQAYALFIGIGRLYGDGDGDNDGDGNENKEGDSG